MPECVLATPLADGPVDGVAATAAGPPLAFASRAAQGANAGQAFDLAAGARLGPPVPDFPADRAAWTFGLLPGGPVAAWTHRERVHVQDVRTGRELVLDAGAGPPDLLGLAVHAGRGAVVAVYGPASDAEAVVWDVLTGGLLAEFALWLGHRSAVDRSALHAVPATGALLGLAGGAGTAVLDVERGEDVAALPPACAMAAQPRRGAVLVHPVGDTLEVRDLDGERLAVLTAPGPCERAAVTVNGRLLVAAALRDDPGAVLAWDAPSAPPRRVKIPAPVTDLALASNGTLLAATDQGLYTAHPCG